MKPILVTGAAGFIGFHICKKLLDEGKSVIGLDNLNSYYNVKLKKDRLKILKDNYRKDKNLFKFKKIDLCNRKNLSKLFSKYKPEIVINMAAQAGVRHSLENPYSYIDSNINGFLNILENCRDFNIKNLIFASSSSVYGGNTNFPFVESNSVNHPISLYASTKISNEMMAHAYSHLFNIPCTGLRFFTIYGPWGRPDMAPMIFANSIKKREKITIFNNGDLIRDFTYIDDVVEIVFKLIEKPAIKNPNFDTSKPDPSSSWCPYKILNVGNNNPIKILEFINLIEKELGLNANKEFIEMQQGDVKKTLANNDMVYEWIGLKPNTAIEIGIRNFINWFKNYYP